MEAIVREHQQRQAKFQAEAAALEATSNRLSLVRLSLFVALVVCGVGAVSQASSGLLLLASIAAALFVAAVVRHLGLLAAKEQAELRAAVHTRHLLRVTGRASELQAAPAEALQEHPYSLDIDLMGPGSLLERIDVSHTRRGEQALITWLAGPAPLATIEARQAAVEELATRVDLRQELEVAAGRPGKAKLDGDPFLEFTRQSSFFARAPWLVPVIHVLPPVTLLTYVAGRLSLIPSLVFVAPLFAQAALVLFTSGAVGGRFDLAAARKGFADAFERMLRLVEREQFEAPHLVALQKTLFIDARAPSVHMRRLDRWVGFAELRNQFPLHFLANLFLLWDLHVLLRLEAWCRDVGERARAFFDGVGELEALSSLATLRHGDPQTSFPVVTADGPLVATGLAHPLLSPERRVANDLRLEGPGSALIVTGSNMAGKSTLLRALGLNVALALSGGPVCAAAFTLPRVRLRASMRVDDSLQRGASYFHAELAKLRHVVAELDQEPVVLFLLDELLRGTNARARHLGAKAVLLHLTHRGAMGLVATHDVALSALAESHPGKIANAHFTDVVVQGEMTFDYLLRAGVVRTSNALRLLRAAGIDVPDDDGAMDPSLELR